jgi:hypothetical protein
LSLHERSDDGHEESPVEGARTIGSIARSPTTVKEDADKRRGRKERRTPSRRIRLYAAPRRFVRRMKIDDLRGTQPVLIGGTVSITQLQVKL